MLPEVSREVIRTHMTSMRIQRNPDPPEWSGPDNSEAGRKYGIDAKGRADSPVAMDRAAYTPESHDERFHALFEDNPVPMWVYDLDSGWIVEVNHAAVAAYGYGRGEFLAMRISQIEAVPLSAGHGDLNGTTVDEAEHETQHRTKNGRIIDVVTWSHNLPFGSRPAVVVVAQDITDRKLAERDVSLSEKRYRALLETSPDGITVTDANGLILMANRVAAELALMETEADLIGRRVSDFLGDVDPDRLEAVHERLITGGRRTNVEHQLVRPDGTRLHVSTNSARTHDIASGQTLVINIIRDITARKQLEERLRYDAVHDRLTGLPNSEHLYAELQRIEASSSRAPLSALMLDIDRFKSINDTFGHQFGDQVLRLVGGRIAEAVPSAELVARLGGDAFVVLLVGANGSEAGQVASRIIENLEAPVECEAVTLHVRGSIGIATSSAQSGDVSTLVQRADVAMSQAKLAQTAIALYSPETDPYSAARRSALDELRTAISTEGMILHYQPQVTMQKREIPAVEALIRWQHPIRGLIAPAEFLPLVEHSDLVTPLTNWVLGTAIDQAQQWRSSGRDVAVAVNISARNLRDTDLITTVEERLEEFRLDPTALKIELTETAIMDDPKVAMEQLTALSDMGIGISVDDFGTGYSSLGYLKRLPVREVKIDRSFVTEMLTNKDDAAIVRSTIDLGHNLGLNVVAEGVEDERTWDVLAVLGCDCVQGFYCDRPLPAADITAKLPRSTKFVHR